MQKDPLFPYLFHEGTLIGGADYFGCHPLEDGSWVFRVWAPNAEEVAVVGDFNDWDQTLSPAVRITDGGIYEAIVKGPKPLDAYKYAIRTKEGKTLLKADPYAVHQETRPSTASKIYALEDFDWTDARWMEERKTKDPFTSPMNIYEVHAGSWRRYADGNFFDYEKLGEELSDYAVQMGYTHLELLPVSEYPFDPSWGYQVSGYFAPTSRYGTPEGLMKFVDICHTKGIGVILDWVPAHFPKDEFGLAKFDGSCAYEYADPRIGEHADWGTLVFDFGKNEVRSFLLSSACNWLSHYHIDGLRVDAVASMLYRDYGKRDGNWMPNQYGGNENLEAISFMQQLNHAIGEHFPGVLTIAEESTIWPGVTLPPETGGLGFHFKWNMGWMNDTLRYMQTDPFFRSHDHATLTNSFSYTLAENYLLPLSHDEVVHEKCSLIGKMPGNYEQKFANLRTYLTFMMTHPGKKLMFMGGEFAQFAEWSEDRELDWLLLSYESHHKFWDFVRTLNKLYLSHPALWAADQKKEGFEWITGDDTANNVIAFLRSDGKGEKLLVLCHFGGSYLKNYRFGMPKGYDLELLLSSDSDAFGGFTAQEPTYLTAQAKGAHFRDASATTDLPEFSAKIFRLVPRS